MKRLVISGAVVLGLALLPDCSAGPGSCQASGGRCTRTDIACGANYVFDGYDPSCEPNSKCCLPVVTTGECDGGACADAGH
jgi:hypothetical protein